MLATTFIGWANAGDTLRVRIRRKSVDSAFLFIAYTPLRDPIVSVRSRKNFTLFLADFRGFPRRTKKANEALLSSGP